MPTDPIARKNEKVAALLNMVFESVERTPRGPAPFLHQSNEPRRSFGGTIQRTA